MAHLPPAAAAADARLDRAAVSLRASFHDAWRRHHAEQHAEAPLSRSPRGALAPGSRGDRRKSPPSPPAPCASPPLVRHRGVEAHPANAREPRGARLDHLRRNLLADARAVGVFVRAETAKLAAHAEALEASAPPPPSEDEDRDAAAASETPRAPWRAAADALSRRADLAAELLEHDIQAADRFERALRRRESGESDAAAGGVVSDARGPDDAPTAADALRRLRVRFEPVVVALGRAHLALGHRDGDEGDARAGGGDSGASGASGASTRSSRWEPPSSFERRTTKYWVRDADVVRVKLALARRLPVLMYRGGQSGDPPLASPANAEAVESPPGGEIVAESGERARGDDAFSTLGGDRDADIDHLRRSSCSSIEEDAIDAIERPFDPIERDSNVVSSVYYDDAGLGVYHSRLRREQGATLVRCRSYGGSSAEEEAFEAARTFPNAPPERRHPNDASAPADASAVVFVERKTHHESWSTDVSVKERFRLLRRDLPAFVDGSGDLERLMRRSGEDRSDSARRLAEEIREGEFEAKALMPSVRTRYRRVAFQRETTNDVRVSLDTELAFEAASAATSDGEEKAAVVFPHAILEVKTRDAPPEWIEEEILAPGTSGSIARIGSGVVEAKKFSKFLHGTAATASPRLRATVIRELPHWWGLAETAFPSDDARDEHEHASGFVTATAEAPELSSGVGDECVVFVESPEAAGTLPAGKPSTFFGRKTAAFFRRADATRGPGAALHGARRDRPSILGSTCFSSARWRTRSPSRKREDASFAARRFAPIKVEPKTFFANERTLLQWLSMAVLVLFTSLALLTLDGGPGAANPGTDPGGLGVGGGFGVDGVRPGVARAPSAGATSPKPPASAAAACGAALAPVAVAFMAYALWTYLWRASRIARREPSARYDDRWGPVALVATLIVASVAAVAVAATSRGWGA